MSPLPETGALTVLSGKQALTETAASVPDTSGLSN